MHGFTCLKNCTLNGVEYVSGNDIPDDAILPSRVRTLTRQGYIAPKAEPPRNTLEKPNDTYNVNPKSKKSKKTGDS